jgi:GT2 family glycosyltransferase
MINIDVICLTNTNDNHFYELTKKTLDTLLSSNGDYTFHIKLIESNKNSELKYDYQNLITVAPTEDFHYNRYLNIGLKYCLSEWVLIINNDLIFTEDWLNNIMIEHQLNPEIKSFSPFEPNFAEYHYPHLYKDGNVYAGYTTGVF